MRWNKHQSQAAQWIFWFCLPLKGCLMWGSNPTPSHHASDTLRAAPTRPEVQVLMFRNSCYCLKCGAQTCLVCYILLLWSPGSLTVRMWDSSRFASVKQGCLHDCKYWALVRKVEAVNILQMHFERLFSATLLLAYDCAEEAWNSSANVEEQLLLFEMWNKDGPSLVTR